ncbi:MAG: hypothetical protein K6F46_05390 [Desulfovibrio sp.]|nr:hypothetical protein [Desulfovibrio sp.]
MIDKFYLENPAEYSKETPEEIAERERKYLVNWMRGVMAEKTTNAAKQAFYNKVYSIVQYHKITFNELI